MAPRARVLTGMKFARLTVLERIAAPGKNPRWLCRCDCGELNEAYGHNLLAGKTKSCGCYRSGPTAWNAKERTIRDGYAFVRDRDHPRASRHGGRVREHILVMEEMLGRPLLQGEEVHHRNGIRDDNRPANLELWIRSQPAGARVEDQVQWAIEILTRYAQDVLVATP
jgi:hypothetical protein